MRALPGMVLTFLSAVARFSQLPGSSEIIGAIGIAIPRMPCRRKLLHEGQSILGHRCMRNLRGNNQPTNAALTKQQVDNQNIVEEISLEQEERLRLVREAGGVAFWDLDPHTKECCWSREAFLLIGARPKHF